MLTNFFPTINSLTPSIMHNFEESLKAFYKEENCLRMNPVAADAEWQINHKTPGVH
jgi:hypothetical protein